MKSFFISLKKFVLQNKIEVALFIGLLCIAAFLRLYNIRNTIIFLGDEGRDALVVKQIVFDGKLTLLGPTASVGGFYLGPIYYYFMIPFMLLFNMDPVGAAVMVAFMGISTVGLLYYQIREWFGVFPAQVVSLLYAIVPGVIAFSRSSWNPNPLPLFTLLMIMALWRAIKKQSWLWAFFAAVSLGIIIQLHYLGLILGGVLGLITLVQIKPQNLVKTIPAEIIGFLLGASFYLGFELRHNFLNIRAVYEFITRSGGATGFKSLNPFWLIYEVNRFNLEAVLGAWSGALSRPLTFIFLLLFIGFFFYKKRQKQPLFSAQVITILLYWGVVTLGMSLYKGQLYYHYFQIFFLAPFLILGMLLSLIQNKKLQLAVIVVSLLTTVVLVPRAPTWEEGSRLLDQTERISDEIIKLSNGEEFNFALITPGNSDHAYRFFLEIKDHKPVPIEEKVTEQLLIVCEKWPNDTCAPLGNPLWEVAGFGRAEIEFETVVHPNITLYRMIHHPESQDFVGKPAPRG